MGQEIRSDVKGLMRYGSTERQKKVRNDENCVTDMSREKSGMVKMRHRLGVEKPLSNVEKCVIYADRKKNQKRVIISASEYELLSFRFSMNLSIYLSIYYLFAAL